MPSLCIASGAPVGGGTASAACAPSNAINLPGGKVAQHVKGLRLVPVALASGAAASRPARRRLALRSRGGERQEEGDFLAGFRLALGSREELLQQEAFQLSQPGAAQGGGGLGAAAPPAGQDREGERVLRRHPWLAES
ncbi:unnamed protein product [Durusdinium trenchii]|uniref:Uncharacterized protein n=1 Tax=Durusdinium trenchii TaxID=1381693 RepID=A0ABP0RQR4_9DINO